MKIRVETDEFYPWYILRTGPGSGGIEVEVDEKTLKRWNRALRSAEAVQQEIGNAIGARA